MTVPAWVPIVIIWDRGAREAGGFILHAIAYTHIPSYGYKISENKLPAVLYIKSEAKVVVMYANRACRVISIKITLIR